MTKYLVRLILDADVVVGYEIKSQTTAKHFPKKGGHIFVEGVDTKHPKIEIDENGNLSIIEDELLLADDIAKKNEKENKKSEFKSKDSASITLAEIADMVKLLI